MVSIQYGIGVVLLSNMNEPVKPFATNSLYPVLLLSSVETLIAPDLPPFQADG
jgi:hypothetical protein